jgi:hypothetical protein
MPNRIHSQLAQEWLFFHMRRSLPVSADDCRLGDLHLIPNESHRAIDPAADLVVNFCCVAGRTGRWQAQAWRREIDPVKSALPGAPPRRSHETVIDSTAAARLRQCSEPVAATHHFHDSGSPARCSDDLRPTNGSAGGPNSRPFRVAPITSYSREALPITRRSGRRCHPRDHVVTRASNDADGPVSTTVREPAGVTPGDVSARENGN